LLANNHLNNDKPFWNGVFEVLKPQPLIGVAEWSELYRVLPPSGSSSSGRWNNSRTPYNVEIMNELSPDSKTKEVITAKGSQLGLSEIIMNWAMFSMNLQPGSFLILQPTEKMAIRFSKQRFSPSIDICEPLKNVIQKNSGNSLLEKVYPGGYVVLSGANSPASLASMPIGNIAFDEVDRYPLSAGEEGDPLDLAKARVATFPHAKMFYASTPTMKETSRIWKLYLDSDQRKYLVPCPHCASDRDVTGLSFEETREEGYFEILFEQLQWTKKIYTDIALHCPRCITPIQEYQKTEMLERGKWKAQNPGHWRAGFHISSLYAPVGWLSWANIAKKFEEAGNDPEKKQVFTNTILGLPWEEQGETIAEEYLSRRVEQYQAQVPEGVLILTMSVDVQKTRLEYEVRGWGKDEESWGIEYGRIEGPTTELHSPDPDYPSVWQRLDDLRMKAFRRENGFEMRIACVMIDSGGIDTTTDTVYNYTLPRERMRVFALKGSSQSSTPIMHKPHRNTRNKCALFRVGVDKAKDLIYARLKIENTGPGYFHFPDNESAGYNAAYFASLTCERKIAVYRYGYKKLQWWKPKDARNEGLDLAVYNLVAIRYLNPNWEALAARYSKQITIPKVNINENSKPITDSINGYSRRNRIDGIHI